MKFGKIKFGKQHTVNLSMALKIKWNKLQYYPLRVKFS